MSPYGVCPTHTLPNIAGGGGCHLCHEDRRRQADRDRLVAEVERLQRENDELRAFVASVSQAPVPSDGFDSAVDAAAERGEG